MIYQHNHSTLLGSKRKSIYYHPTGTGRDTYIMTDNGGTNIKYTYQGVPQLGNFMKFGPIQKGYKPQSHTRFHKYTSDGSGRDKYVVSKHGGQYLQDHTVNEKLVKFRKTMRDGGQWRGQKTTTTWRSQSQMKKHQQMNKTQRSNISRLSVPKFQNFKYQQELINLRNKHVQTLMKKSRQIDNENQEVQF